MFNDHTTPSQNYTPNRPRSPLAWNIFRSLFALFLSLFILYPLLHEFGHALSVWLWGGEVVRITIYPAICTECIIPSENLLSIVMTGFSGILFPMFLSMLIPSRWLISSVISLALRLMVLIDTVSELLATAHTILGSPSETSDLSVAILKSNFDPHFILVMVSVLAILGLISVLLTQPVQIAEKMLGSLPGPTGSHPHYDGYHYHHS